MRTIILSCCILMLAASAYSAPLSDWDQRMFWGSFQSSCSNNMKKTSTMNKSQITAWCECVGFETIKLMVKEDLQSNHAASLNQKTKTASSICQDKLLTPSGTFR